MVVCTVGRVDATFRHQMTRVRIQSSEFFLKNIYFMLTRYWDAGRTTVGKASSIEPLKIGVCSKYEF